MSKKKVTGQDLIDFFKEWPPGDGVHMEEVPFIQDDGGELYEETADFERGPLVDPAKNYELSGYLCSGMETTDDFATYFWRWLKKRTVTVIAVTVPNADVEAFKAHCASLKYRVG